MYADSNVESYEKVLNQVLIGKLLEEIMDKDVKKTLLIKSDQPVTVCQAIQNPHCMLLILRVPY